MRIRIRGPGGQSVATIPEDATVSDLRSKIAKTTSISSFEVKYGYPPKDLQLENLSEDLRVSDLGVPLNGEQLIISEKVEAQEAPPVSQIQSSSSQIPPDQHSPGVTASSTTPLSLNPKQSPEDPPELAIPARASTLLIRVMPDDNSCLFRAFNSAFFGAMDNMHELRSIIAQSIQADPATYSAVVLEKSPDDYCRWIQSSDAWGGQIELDILSKHFDMGICSIDVQTLRVDRYNEGRPNCCILVYSGIHYDVIALSPSDSPYEKAYAPPEFDTKIFEAEDNEILDKAIELCRLLNQKGYFTDTAGFSIKCNVCGGMFVGEKGAVEHAQETGHYDFGET